MRPIVTACLAIGLLLSGCTGGRDAGPGPKPSPEVSARPSAGVAPAPTTTEAAEPSSVPDPPAAQDRRKARLAFADYVLEAWIYALNTNDPTPLLDVSRRGGCTGCPRLVRELETREEDGWHVALEGVRVSKRSVTASGREARAVLSVSIPRSNTYNADGSRRGTNPGHPHSTFEVEMRRAGREFRLESFSVY